MKDDSNNGKFSEKRNRRMSLFALLSISFLSMSGMNLSPALNRIAVSFPEETEAAIQSIVTLPSLLVVFSSFLSQPLSKLITRKKTILLGSFIFTASGLMPFFFDSFPIIRLSRMLIGVGIGLIIPLSTTILFSLYSDENQRNSVIGLQSSVTALGSIVATSLVGLLAGINYKLSFLVHLLGVFTFLINLFFLPQDSSERRERIIHEKMLPQNEAKWQERSKPFILFWYLLMFLYMAFLNAFSTKISLFTENSGIGDTNVSALGISLFTIGTFVGGALFGKISRLLRKYTIGIGMFLSGVGLLFLAFASAPIHIYSSGLLTGFGMCMTTPVILVGVVNNSSENNRTLAIAINSAMSNLGLSLSTYITSFMAFLIMGEERTIRKEYQVCAIVLLVFGVLALLAGFWGIHSSKSQ